MIVDDKILAEEEEADEEFNNEEEEEEVESRNPQQKIKRGQDPQLLSKLAATVEGGRDVTPLPPRARMTVAWEAIGIRYKMVKRFKGSAIYSNGLTVVGQE